jgi:16S rRNA (uracil1498-N3)-methyltransferase
VSDRFFIATPITSDRVTLDGPEAHHLLHVMRAATGDHLTLFDGAGSEYSAVVETMKRSDAVVRIVERREVNRELPIELVLGIALPKGERQKWLVEKLTELGATTLVPLSTQRGVAQPTAGAIERLIRAVIEGAKQCGRNRLMQVTEPQTWNNFIAIPPQNAAALRIIAHPGGSPIGQLDLRKPSRVFVAIGPEGGLTDAEVAVAIAAGWQQVSLGPRILRVETAAIALAAAISLAFGES